MLKKVAAINDLSGIGKCSLTVAIPILSTLKVQCCPFPTAILSSQTGFSEYTFLDLTDEMKKYSNTWKNLNLEIDTICSGFLGSIDQIDIVSNFIKENPQSFVIVDPVLGDDGVMYPIFSEKTCEEMKNLVIHSNLITPNITEACLLLNKEFRKNFSEKEIINIAKDLSDLGPEKVIITGIIRNEMIYNLSYDRKTNKSFTYGLKYNKCSYSGTGDIFVSIICGLITNNYDLDFAVKTASDFIYKCVSYTSKYENDRNQGVMFEMFLNDLTSI
ncbi:pyridoxamine kinase [Terrisporobacter petrolearius]|uniref:pyridoxamine kinase n=1 Tax=Terrisporobacter petrolearius TaxID=1460447 RepID=UPI0031CC8248